jgi:hypothetical protein
LLSCNLRLKDERLDRGTGRNYLLSAWAARAVCARFVGGATFGCLCRANQTRHSNATSFRERKLMILIEFGDPADVTRAMRFIKKRDE